MPNRVFIGYLPQETPVMSDESVLEYLARVSGIEALQKQKDVLEKRLDDPAVLAQYEQVVSEYEQLGGDQFQKRAHKYLKGLALTGLSFTTSVETVSGGQKRKLALTGVLLRGVDMLVLDEPTNNLDAPALVFLQEFLRTTKATVIFASHDREFMDAVAEKVFEIDWFERTVEQYTGGYSEYLEIKAHALRRQKELYREQEEERGRLGDSQTEKEDWVERVKKSRKRDNAKMADHFKRERATKKFHAAAKSIETRMKKLNKHEEPQERGLPRIDFGLPVPGEEQLVAYTIQATDLKVGYAGGFISSAHSFVWQWGARVALVGNNGAGKTTLLATMAGALKPVSGSLSLGEQVKIGYFIQEHDRVDQREKVENYWKRQREEGMETEEVLAMLQALQLSPTVLRDRLEELSPGERVRVLLAGLVLAGVNTLFLDEPTNHLDLDAIEALEEALRSFPGTLVVVTHDQKFLENLNIDTKIEL